MLNVTSHAVRVPRAPRGPFRRWPRQADAILAGLVLAATLLVKTDPDAASDFAIRSVRDLAIVGYMLALLGSVALNWRRRSPLAVYGVIVGVSAVSVWLGSPDPFFFPFAVYSLGRYETHERWSAIGVGGAVAFGLISALRDGETLPDTAGGVMFVFVLWYIGRRIRVRRTYLTVLREHALRLEQNQAAEARQAVVEERSRIARELHDVVAHKVSLMTVQAGAAKTVVGDDPEAAVEAMQAVEHAGRQALGELRHLLGVLRPDSDEGVLVPQSGLVDVPTLIEQFGSAGLPVALDMENIPTNLATRIELSAYRIIQEALTNVLKHAGPNPQAEVVIGFDSDDMLHVEVADRGVGRLTPSPSGHGIVGMRERALLLDGTLEAGPRAGGGFRVRARLPVGGEDT